jgi:hypothetical protein
MADDYLDSVCIHVGHGKYTVIDIADYEIVACRRWHIVNGYVRAGGGKGYKYVNLARLLLNPPAGMVVDHINNDRLDNRRRNLRIATIKQNGWNRRLDQSALKCGYRGIHKSKKRWKATIRVNEKNVNLGHFLTAEDAATAYNLAALKHFREFAKLNWIRAGLPPAIAAPRLHGQSIWNAKLTPATVREARCLKNEGWSFSSLAKRYGVGKTTIRYAVSGKQWKSAATAGAVAP